MATMTPVPGGFIGHTADTTILVTDQQIGQASANEADKFMRPAPHPCPPDTLQAAIDAAHAPYETDYWTENGGRR